MRLASMVVGICVLSILRHAGAYAQDNYEIQVYGSETVPEATTMIELHSNFTAKGSTSPTAGVLPSNHALHETLEITHGFLPWFEVGAYLFTDLPATSPYQLVGSHIRPRVRVPDEWEFNFGVGFGLTPATDHTIVKLILGRMIGG